MNVIFCPFFWGMFRRNHMDAYCRTYARYQQLGLTWYSIKANNHMSCGSLNAYFSYKCWNKMERTEKYGPELYRKKFNYLRLFEVRDCARNDLRSAFFLSCTVYSHTMDCIYCSHRRYIQFNVSIASLALLGSQFLCVFSITTKNAITIMQIK